MTDQEVIDDIVYAIQRRHGSFSANLVLNALIDFQKKRPDDLCHILRKVWHSCPDEHQAAPVIAQAIDLGLGVERARQILTALARRDLTEDKVGDDVSDR